MDWLLFLYSTDDFTDVRFIFSGLDRNETYKEFMLSNYNDLSDMEQKIIDIMNFQVAIRDNVYLLCNLRDGNGEYYTFCNKMSELSKRVRSGVIDIESFHMTSKIMKKLHY